MNESMTVLEISIAIVGVVLAICALVYFIITFARLSKKRFSEDVFREFVKWNIITVAFLCSHVITYSVTRSSTFYLNFSFIPIEFLKILDAISLLLTVVSLIVTVSLLSKMSTFFEMNRRLKEKAENFFEL